VKLFHYLVLFNSFFFLLVFFYIRSCCSLFSLYKHLLWNLSLDSWSTWKSKQNGILVCEIWWTFEVLKILKNDCVFLLLFVKKWLRRKMKLTSSPLTSGSHLFCLICSFYCTPFFRSAPPFLFFYFFTFFFIISLAFIYLFLSLFSFFLLSISRNMQHYLMYFFYFYFPLFFLFSLF